ncbi:Organelle RRM domain-containing protein 2 [Cardamine amara subsp. amara]|uniref:Organelle RRM domain-containing protein 2 n=1 Tax=Cardamine amara subsp. amara TaxID=228776 RepID=A0ABD1AIR6_CARAN
MAMAMRLPAITRAVTEVANSPVGFRRLFCSNASKFSFLSPQAETQTPARPQADPSTNLFVSGLSKRTTSEGLRTAFAQFGEVADAKVVTDRVSGYSKGFGFVRYATLEDSAKGIAGMDGKFLDGWVIFAEYARPREQSQSYQPQNNMSRPPYSPYGNR